MNVFPEISKIWKEKDAFFLPWPASSPDLSPLDYSVKNFLKEAVRKKVGEKAKPDVVRAAILEVCDEMSQEYIDRIIGTFPDRLRKYIAVGGDTFEHTVQGPFFVCVFFSP